MPKDGFQQVIEGDFAAVGAVHVDNCYGRRKGSGFEAMQLAID